MSVAKRGSAWYIRARLWGRDVIAVKTPAETKADALRIERALLVAVESGDYSGLTPQVKATAVRLFGNRGLEIPPSLAGTLPRVPSRELTLWDAVGLFVKYPSIRGCSTLGRYTECLAHLVRILGRETPVKAIWVPELRVYQSTRQGEGVAPATVNKETGVLSRLFTILAELKLVEANPCRLVKKLSEKAGEREVYISFQDFERIVDYLPEWYRPIAQTAYYTGMRRGEIVGLTRKQVDLTRRMITLGVSDTKEKRAKRIPIHRDLVPILEAAMRVRAFGTDNIFLHNGRPITTKDQLRWAWDRKVCKAGIEPTPRFHDLRHCWRTNARRSGMHPEIEKAIMGHADRARSVHERYGRISDEELLRAVDLMTFDHGGTEIWVASKW